MLYFLLNFAADLDNSKTSMKNVLIPIMLCILTLCSCKKYETYSDKKAKERDAIDQFITKYGITVITEAQFNAQGQTTDVDANEYVRFSRNGVYMQIVRPGYGNKLEENKTVNLLCRFVERNIMTDSTLIRNDQINFVTSTSYGTFDTSQFVDKMSVKRTGTTMTASFVSGMMYQYHGSSTVPAGWLVPLNYVSIDRPDPASDVDAELAKVRLIVPHSQGTADASASVYPCYYEITYVRER